MHKMAAQLRNLNKQLEFQLSQALASHSVRFNSFFAEFFMKKHKPIFLSFFSPLSFLLRPLSRFSPFPPLLSFSLFSLQRARPPSKLKMIWSTFLEICYRLRFDFLFLVGTLCSLFYIWKVPKTKSEMRSQNRDCLDQVVENLSLFVIPVPVTICASLSR